MISIPFWDVYECPALVGKYDYSKSLSRFMRLDDLWFIRDSAVQNMESEFIAKLTSDME